jgi:WD40 repeat protein
MSISAGVIAVTDDKGDLSILTLEDGALVSHYSAPSTSIELQLALSPTQTLLAVGQASYGAEQVLIYDLTSGAAPASLDLNLYGSDILSLTFGATDADLYVGLGSKAIQVWDPETQQLVTTIDLELSRLPIFHGIALNPNQRVMAFINFSRDVYRWDMVSNQALPLLQGHPDNIYALGFSPDGTLLASLDGNQDLILWDTATWEESRFVTDTGGAGALAFSPDGRLLAVAGYEDNVSLWDVQTGNLVVQFQGHPRGVADVTFSNDGTLLVTAGYDGLVRLWAVP